MPSLFFASADKVAAVVPRVEEVVGLVAREVAEATLLVVPVKDDLVGLVGLVVVACPTGLFSTVEAGLMVDLRSVDDERGLVPDVRVVVDGANDILLAVPVMPGFLFSSVELVDC